MKIVSQVAAGILLAICTYFILMEFVKDHERAIELGDQLRQGINSRYGTECFLAEEVWTGFLNCVDDVDDQDLSWEHCTAPLVSACPISGPVIHDFVEGHRASILDAAQFGDM